MGQIDLLFRVLPVCVCSHSRYLTQKRNEENAGEQNEEYKKGLNTSPSSVRLSYFVRT